jgi:hypothetical protein
MNCEMIKIQHKTVMVEMPANKNGPNRALCRQRGSGDLYRLKKAKRKAISWNSCLEAIVIEMGTYPVFIDMSR